MTEHGQPFDHYEIDTYFSPPRIVVHLEALNVTNMLVLLEQAERQLRGELEDAKLSFKVELPSTDQEQDHVP